MCEKNVLSGNYLNDVLVLELQKILYRSYS